MTLTQLLDAGALVSELTALNRDTAIRELTDALDAHGAISDPVAVAQQIIEREDIATTAIGGGIAIPHALTADLDHSAMAIGRSDGLSFGESEENAEAIRLVFMLVGPNTNPALHLQTLAKLSELACDGDVVDDLLAASPDEVAAILDEFEQTLS
ncbi:MAG: PTS sugar transporter subunit IIA [Candidatus Latescibacteria bacterium]|jgi:mannitol/fructose-specific phosphotransferase system IIA component (Ntr-type)|nr:PTS sugar transporter subunit IIA [Candidatus Latescibacterota bacterium]